jgi:glycosyltransferase involved in cell wall biosynthesis
MSHGDGQNSSERPNFQHALGGASSRRGIRLAIDASNIRAGGPVTHLVEVLRTAEPVLHGFERVCVWACESTLERIEERTWLEKRSAPALEGNLFKRIIWQRFVLSRHLRDWQTDLLFAPGGSIIPRFRPVVTMCRNMLPFEWKELRRFGISWMAVRLLLLRWNNSQSFRKADGTIFLTRYAYDAIRRVTGPLIGRTSIVPHGVDDRFRVDPEARRIRNEFTFLDPIRTVYVSTIDEYKHQWRVVEAVARLRREGIPISLDLYGSARASTLPRLTSAIDRFDGQGEFVRYRGPVDHDEIHECYAAADLSVFASSCENMPNVLLESMAAALPIACSNLGPMPEVLGDAGLYFDPEDSASIATAVRILATMPHCRVEKAFAASAKAAQFSWARCARETFEFLAAVMSNHARNGSAESTTRFGVNNEGGRGSCRSG